jgi:hypothetical protein
MALSQSAPLEVLEIGQEGDVAGISSSQVSRICADKGEEVGARRSEVPLLLPGDQRFKHAEINVRHWESTVPIWPPQ